MTDVSRSSFYLGRQSCRPRQMLGNSLFGSLGSNGGKFGGRRLVTKSTSHFIAMTKLYLATVNQLNHTSAYWQVSTTNW